jgi:hypothetical protein
MFYAERENQSHVGTAFTEEIDFIRERKKKYAPLAIHR